MKSRIGIRKIGMKSNLWLIITVLLAWTSTAGLGTAPGRAAASAGEKIVYDDQINEAFSDNSWAQIDLSASDEVHGGDRSIRMEPNGDDGLYLYSDRILRTADYPVLEFWVHGGESGGQQLELVLQAGGEPVAALPLDAALFGKGNWQKVTIDLKQYVPGGLFDGILIRGTASDPQAAIYLDDIVLIEGADEDPAGGGGDDPVVVPDEQEEPAGGEGGNPGGGGTGTQDYPEAGITIYDDYTLNPAFQDNSWAQHNWQDTAYVHAGESAASFNPGNRGGLYMYKDSGGAVDVKHHDRLVFWINGGAAGGQAIELVLKSGGEESARVNIGGFIEGGRIPANSWTPVTVDLQALQLKDGIFDGILLQGAKDEAQSPVYLDDIRLLEKYVAPPAMVEGVLSQYGLALAPGDVSSVNFEARYTDGSSVDVSPQAAWSSSNPNVVAVDQGRLTAVGSGLAKITAAYGDATASLYVQVTAYDTETVYDDRLASGYSDWSWGTQNFANQTPAASGSRSISFAAKGYEGIWMHRDTIMDLTNYYGLTLNVYGGSGGGQHLRVNLMDGRNFVGDFDLSKQLPAGVPAGQWTEVKLKFTDLGMSGDLSFDGIVISAWGEEDQGTVYLDDISMLKTTAVIQLPAPELPAVQVTVDASQPRRTLSPGIFGLNFEDSPSENYSEVAVPIKRWGGNQMTRYNWQLNTTNRGGDWYFLNVPYDDKAPSDLPEESLSDRFIQDSIDTHTDVLLQIPTIGWTPKSREIGWSFSVQKYGKQQSNECDWGEAWCREDAGNGKKKDGSYLTGNDPEDTSKQVGPAFISDWIAYLQNRFGDAVHNYALDNEPMLWGHAHWDVHPQMTTYDEVWNYTQEYGQAIKSADPQANIFGPVPWGWCEYFYSAADGCSPGPDMAAHGGKPYMEWLLGKNEAYRQQNGHRLIDTLDIHYYPAEDNIAFSSDESPAMTKRRFNSLKSLYDPSFVDPSSWIQEPVRLLPRMHELIDSTSPGMKLSISEYNFGDGSGIGSGLAQAEALALFAREGVDYAMRWGALEAGTPLEDAFKLYLNYDGHGSRVEGEVVSTASSNNDAVGAYTIVSPQGQTFVLLFNKDSAPRQAALAADLNLAETAEVYRFESRKRLYRADDMQGTSAGLSLTLPAKSATLLVMKEG